MMRFARRLFLICPLSCMAWSATLSLGAGSSAPGGSVSLSLNLTSSGSSVVGTEWTLNYSTADFASINITAGSSVTAAAKQLSCSNPAAGRYVCLVSGLNQDVIPDGVLATAVLNIASTSTSTSSNVGVGAPSATDPNGVSISTTATGSAVTIVQPTATVSRLSCSPSSITVPNSTTCSVTLSAGAPAGGTPVSLGYAATGATVSIPTSVTVPAGSTQQSFTAQAVSATSSTSVILAATSNGTSASFSLAIAPALITTQAAPPTAPANLTGVATSTSQINLSWTASTSNLGIAAYLIESCRGSGCTNFAQIAQTTATTYSNTGLQSKTIYRYRVRAKDTAGNLGAYSNIAAVKTRWK